MIVVNFETIYALHDPAHCFTPNLFRSLKPCERKKMKLKAVHEFGSGKRIEFSGPEPLGADDLRVLQGLVAMAGSSGLTLSPEPSTEVGMQLRLSLDIKWDAVQQNVVVIKSSYAQLAREIGNANVGNTTNIRASIERLWKVSVIVQAGTKRQGFRLLSEYSSDKHYGKLNVALNPLITSTLFGNRQFVRIDMDEVRALKSDPARLIHQRLCSWIDPGKLRRVELDTLSSYVWPDKIENVNSIKKRRQTTRKALAELAGLGGWIVNEYVHDKFEIKRPSVVSKIRIPP